jgi:2-oxoglutarate dehydrogenase E2 component (dihydrolipoamide succinyltransferase)
MPTKVLVPRLGEGVDELTIVKWLKKEGDPVNELEPLLEVETDKVVTEIPSPASGYVLKILVEENTPATVGMVMAWIGEAGELTTDSKTDTIADKRMETDVAQAPVAPHNPLPVTHDMGFLSPVVRKIAGEHNIDLSQVQGTGLNGRITKQDILNYVERGASNAAHRTPHTTPDAGRHDTSEGTLIRHTSMRRSIAEHMLASKKTSPHVLTVMEADMSRIIAHRAANKDAFSRDGVNLTFTAYFVAAIVAGLKSQPLANATWTDDGILVHKDINVGMAVALDKDGLIVPVIKNADGLSLVGIARSVNDLAYRAREHKLQPEEVRGGTFTLTNHGTGGSLFAMPIINQPQCGILGIGSMQKRVVAVADPGGNDAIAVRPMLYLSLVFDHRILDGSSADGFLMKVKEILDNWS